MMFPTDMDASFLAMAVRVVTSSGREVPTATMVTPMMRDGAVLPLAGRFDAGALRGVCGAAGDLILS